MDQAAHHLDLFFENPSDPEEVLQARQNEMDLVESWVRDGYKKSLSKHRFGGEDHAPPMLPSFSPGNIGLLADW